MNKDTCPSNRPISISSRVTAGNSFTNLSTISSISYVWTNLCPSWWCISINHHRIWLKLSNILFIGTQLTISFFKFVLECTLTTVKPSVSTITRLMHSNRTSHSTGTAVTAECVVRSQSWRSTGASVTRWEQNESPLLLSRGLVRASRP